MKSAIINPLLKKLNLALLQKNDRPVSNLKYLSQLIERVIAQKLNEHLTRNYIFEPMQSAYRKAQSTETALVGIQNDILRATDNQEFTILLLLDLSAAFHTVNHAILINRLEKSVGIKGNALKWFVSYLNGRRQCVMINNASSQFADIKFGVPQGSVLGPTLFSLYTLLLEY